MIGWMLGLIGVGGIAALIFVPGLFAAVAAFVVGVFDVLMRVSVPLLIAMVAAVAFMLPSTWRWAVVSHRLHVSEAARASLVNTNDQLSVALETLTGNVRTLTASLRNQNAAVGRWKAESEEASRRATQAAREARAQAKRYETRIDRIRAAKPSEDVCASARALVVKTLSEDRP